MKRSALTSVGVAFFFAVVVAAQDPELQRDATIQDRAKSQPDAEFLRRAHIDLLGSVPAPVQVRTFLEDTDPRKREKLLRNLVAERLKQGELKPESDTQFLRRAHVDILKSPPTPYQVKTFLEDTDPKKREKWLGKLVAQRIEAVEGDATPHLDPLELVHPVADIVSSPDRSLFATIVYRRGKPKEPNQPREAAKSDLEVEQEVFATVTVRDAKTGKEKFTTGELKDPRIHRFIFSPDGKTLAISFQRPFSEGVQTDKVELWDLKTGNVKRRLELDHGGCMAGLAFSLDGKTLAVTGHGDRGTTGGVRLIDVESGSQKKALRVEKAIVAEVAFSPDGETLASTSSGMDKQEVLLWDVSAGKVKKVLESTSEDVLSLAFSPDGKRLAGGGANGQLELWDLKTGKATALPSPSELTDKLAFSPDGKYLAASGRSPKDRKYVAEARLWDLVTSRLLKSEEDSQVIAFSADGANLAILQKSKKVIYWDIGK